MARRRSAGGGGAHRPPPNDVRRLAEALTGGAIPLLDGWYEHTAVTRELSTGAVLDAIADRHPDPIAEAIRWQICEGELQQIIGRARGVNRTEADPVEILVMTDVPLPLPVDATLRLADLEPGPDEKMLAAGGIAFANPTDASAAYPELWETRNAAKCAMRRPVSPLAVGVKPV